MAQKIKEIVGEDSLDFAINHINRYYDTDFFPRAEEFHAIKYSWKDAKEYIEKCDIDSIFSAAPIVEPWPKPRGGYRIVHRLEPLDSLLYTALAKTVCSAVEEGRDSPEVACAYRISESESSFFSDGSGFSVYRERCENLSSAYPYVLCADIAEFYNKIYLHRLQNSIQSVCDSPHGISKRIEYFLMLQNTKASQGIPVGPAASIIMAEAAMIDVDQFIKNRGVPHVRYVDDFRIFGNSEAQLSALHQELCVYLHENHRLSLAGEKTSVKKSSDFLSKELNNQYQLEKLEIFQQIEVVNPYTMQVDELKLVVLDDAGEILSKALRKVTKYEYIDLGVTRAIVRRARAHKIKDIFDVLIEHLSLFSAAINDIALYLDEICDASFSKERMAAFEALCNSDIARSRAVRLWLEWFFSRNKILLSSHIISSYVFSGGNLRAQAVAAITTKNQAWVKERKSQLLHYTSWHRRSIILAAQVLSKDEREKWLNPISELPALSRMDAWMVKWVLKNPDELFPFGDDDIPF